MENQITTQKDLERALVLITEAHKFSKPFNATELFNVCQELVALESYLIKPLLEAEQAYKRTIEELRITEKLSFAAAKNKAEILPEYFEYKRIKYVKDLIGEETKLTKKFAMLLREEENQGY